MQNAPLETQPMAFTFKSFFQDESGAITVDWVVLTAACVSLALGAMMLISGAVRDNGTEASTIMETYEIDHEFDTQAEIAALQEAANDALTPAVDPDPAPVN